MTCWSQNAPRHSAVHRPAVTKRSSRTAYSAMCKAHEPVRLERSPPGGAVGRNAPYSSALTPKLFARSAARGYPHRTSAFAIGPRSSYRFQPPEVVRWHDEPQLAWWSISSKKDGDEVGRLTFSPCRHGLSLSRAMPLFAPWIGLGQRPDLPQFAVNRVTVARAH